MGYSEGNTDAKHAWGGLLWTLGGPAAPLGTSIHGPLILRERQRLRLEKEPSRLGKRVPQEVEDLAPRPQGLAVEEGKLGPLDLDCSSQFGLRPCLVLHSGGTHYQHSMEETRYRP